MRGFYPIVKILVYKRTHTGDPNPDGVFGCNDCMGIVRNSDYDAVIGIGVQHPDSGHDISCKVTWVGVGPHKHNAPPGHRAPLVTFDGFVLLDSAGPTAPPALHPTRLPRSIVLYEGRVGYEEAYNEAVQIIGWVQNGELRTMAPLDSEKHTPMNKCKS